MFTSNWTLYLLRWLVRRPCSRWMLAARQLIPLRKIGCPLKKKTKSNFPRARGNKASDGQLITRRLETSWTKRMLQCIPKSQHDVDYEIFLSRSRSRLKEKTFQVGGAGGETMIQSQKVNQSWWLHNQHACCATIFEMWMCHCVALIRVSVR